MPVARLAVGEDGAGGDVEGGKQGGGAMADIVVGDAFDIAQPHGQHGLGAAQGLNLDFLIDAQHHGVIGRVQIQAHDVAHLLDEERIGGELEGFAAMRLQGKALKDPVHGGFRQPVGFRGLANTPVGSGGRPGLQRTAQQRGHLFVGNRAWPTRTQLVIQALDAVLDETLPPLAHRGLRPPQARGNLGVGAAFGGPQHQPGPRHQRMRKTPGCGKSSQVLLLLRRQFQRGFGTSERHTQAYPRAATIASYLWDITLGTHADSGRITGQP